MHTAAAIRSLIALSALASLSGCYVLQAAQGQLAISSQHKPIAEVIANPNTPVAVQRRLQLAIHLLLPDQETIKHDLLYSLWQNE